MYPNKISQIDVAQKEIDTHRPLNKYLLQELKEYYRIGFTYTSNALEGNSLTETETKIVLEQGITIAGKLLKDHFEAIGHSEAYTLCHQLAGKKTITEDDILQLHKLFYYHVDRKQAGKYREQKVFISGTTFIPPTPKEIPTRMKSLVEDIPVMRKKYHPVEVAALLHKELVTIHPFIDGNGRCARLVMNLLLLQDGYVITIIPPLLRNDYIEALQKAQLPPYDNQPFINFISCMVYESQKDYLRMLKA